MFYTICFFLNKCLCVGELDQPIKFEWKSLEHSASLLALRGVWGDTPHRAKRYTRQFRAEAAAGGSFFFLYCDVCDEATAACCRPAALAPHAR